MYANCDIYMPIFFIYLFILPDYIFTLHNYHPERLRRAKQQGNWHFAEV